MAEAPENTGVLVIVATPIGNLDDLSKRALDALAEADLIAAEDTRRTRRLLSHFGLKKPLIAVHDHNEIEVSAKLLQRLAAGENVVLVSDAGTPLISDPGYRLVTSAIDRGVAIRQVPGPSAVIAALTVAGLAVDSFSFEGFLPPKAESRRARLAQLENEPRTLVFFESVHRVGECLRDMVIHFGADRRAAVCRELTKAYESVYRGELADLVAQAEDGRLVAKGEFVIVVAGSDAEPDIGAETDRLLQLLLAELPLKAAVRIAVELTGGRRNEIYQRALALIA